MEKIIHGRPPSHGFSLVELSIVLVILGLLTGGILAGQSLIRAAELRSISTDVSRYTTSMQAFRDKYFALPGDMTNAAAFWGTAAACPGAAAAAGTCNGNGNNIVEPLAATYGNEYFRFWQHLALAGLIEGTYSGVAGGGGGTPTEQPILGTNVPAARITSSGYSINYLNTPVTVDNHGFWFIRPAGNILAFGTTLGNSMLGRSLKPEETWNIDTKLDDGRPAYGIMHTPNSNNPNGGTNCVTTSVASTAEYLLSNSGNNCSLMFWIFNR